MLLMPITAEKEALFNQLIVGDGQFHTQRLLEKRAEFLRGILLTRARVRRNENGPVLEPAERDGGGGSACYARDQHSNCQ